MKYAIQHTLSVAITMGAKKINFNQKSGTFPIKGNAINIPEMAKIADNNRSLTNNRRGILCFMACFLVGVVTPIEYGADNGTVTFDSIPRDTTE